MLTQFLKLSPILIACAVVCLQSTIAQENSFPPRPQNFTPQFSNNSKSPPAVKSFESTAPSPSKNFQNDQRSNQSPVDSGARNNTPLTPQSYGDRTNNQLQPNNLRGSSSESTPGIVTGTFESKSASRGVVPPPTVNSQPNFNNLNQGPRIRPLDDTTMQDGNSNSIRPGLTGQWSPEVTSNTASGIVRDSATIQASHTSQDSKTANNNVEIANQFLKNFDIGEINGVLPGQPVSIKELIAISPSSQHAALVDAYWRTFEAWANQQTNSIEFARLQGLARVANGADQQPLQTELALSNARFEEAKEELKVAQKRLARFAPTVSQGVLPIPSDLPFVGKYRTNYEVFSNSGTINQRLQDIHTALPAIMDVIEMRSIYALQNERSAVAAVQAYNRGTERLGTTVAAIRATNISGNELMKSIRRYNTQIGEYAFAIVPSGQSPETLVGMLIRPKLPIPAMQAVETQIAGQPDTGIRQAANTTPNIVEPGQWRRNPPVQNSNGPAIQKDNGSFRY